MSVLAPLLRPAAWRLSPGAADVPWLRHLGMTLLSASAVALLSWCVATWLESWRHRELGWASVVAVPLCLLGLRHAWLLAQAWLVPGTPLTLRWTGPVNPSDAGEPVGGWRVDEWGAQPVDVRLVWDWQRLMLLQVRPRQAASRDAWIWLQDRPGPSDQPGDGVHRLRTLLCLPPAMTGGHAAQALPLPLKGTVASASCGMMASSRHDPSIASARMKPRLTPERPVRPANLPAPAPSTAPLRFEDDFPATQVLEGWHDESPDAHGASGGRP